MKLKSIKEEAAACRKAFKGVTIGAYVLHCHHDVAVEVLSFLPASRIEYILAGKPPQEQALRLRLFRPISRSKWWAVASCADWADEKHHTLWCVKDCPWNGKTIFPGKECLP